MTTGAWRFGLEMGTGLRTYVPAVAPYVLLLGLVLARPTLAEVLLAAAGFGVGRTVPLAVRINGDPRAAMPNGLVRWFELRGSQAAAAALVLVGALVLV